MEEKYFDKLTKELSDRLSKSLKDEIKAVKEEQDETIAKLKEQNEVIAERIEKIQNQPAEKVAVAVPGKEDKKVNFYKGYNLKKMGSNLAVEPYFKVADEDREIASKFLIDVVQGKATNVEGTASRGGYLVPDEYSDIVMSVARLKSIALQEAYVIPMRTDVLRIPKEASNIAVSWGSEESTLAVSNPTFGEIVLTANRLGAYGIVSNELLADEQYDFVSILTSQFGEAIGQELDDSMFNAGGSSTFTGALSGATTNTVTCAATATSPNRHIQLTNDELSQAISKLTSNKLVGAKFYFHQNSMHYVRVQEDTAGNPIFALPGNGVPGTVYEYPYVVSAKVGAASPAAATPFVLFGNLKRCYVIGQRMGNMTLEIDPYGLFDTYRTRYRMVTRWDGEVALEDGLVAIKTHA